MVQIKNNDRQQFKNAAGDINAIMAGKLWAATRNESIDHLPVIECVKMLCRAHDELFDVPDHRRFNMGVSDDLIWRAAMGTAPIVETFSTVIGNAMLSAVENEPSTTQGWVYEGELPHFLGVTWFVQEYAARLERLARGDVAQQTSFGTKGEAIQLCRYASQFVIDDQDWLNGNATVGAVKLAASEQAVAAQRLKDDLIYALLLSNPTLSSDNLAVFHSSHNNLASGGGSVLSATSLDSATAAIGKQYLKAEQDKYPTHANLRARYIIVPPDLTGAMLRACRNMECEDGPLFTIRQESRLSSIGVVDPHSGTVYTGSATNWLACAKASSRPSIVVAGLDGPPKPQIRSFVLDRGQWGLGWDVTLDIAAAFVDYRGVYFSVGA